MAQSILINARTGEIVVSEYDDGIVPPPEPTPEEAVAAQRESIRLARFEAFKVNADPLYLKWQRGEATEQEWLDAVQAVRDALPYP